MFINGNGDPISVEVVTNNLPHTLASIRKQYETFFPGNLFDYFFLKERYNQQYKDDAVFSKVFGLFAGFAVFVACLGLFGLSLFSTAQRTKEIGTRKVLGASAFQIVSLLSRDFLKLIILSIAIALPIGWYAVNKWLENFAYSTSIQWWVFVVAGLIALLIAFFTVSFQAIKAALDNPVKSLRTE